ncbi:hypothetical protein [Streptomonospora litoralis]|uniref:Integral membrane protein n=1 Tax=Streptomonospora litoralis TaxID=2498135 RepID=A0A4P6PVS9_9ACTN|nr:hypothetical protein [Streptomonospora litoralis]QBI52193.1 hypothetical protein EKD16_01880 [Streptomonospora litoralis]
MPEMHAVELRVHGVSGGAAAELLDVEPAVRVSGGPLAGFFRWRRKEDTETVPGVPREIFAWGKLTSGRSSRALWLLLLPFMLVNLAYWMRPARGAESPSRWAAFAEHTYRAAARLLALSLTALLVLAAAGVGMDLAGWQCAGYGRECVQLRPLLSMLSAPPLPLAEPARAPAAGALLPLSVIALLWWLSQRSSAGVVTEALPTPAPRAQAPLSGADFWRHGTTQTARLRSAHIAVAVCVVAFLLAAPALQYDGLSIRGAAAGLPIAVLLAATTVLSAAGTVVPGSTRRWERRADTACRLLRNIALVLLIAALAYALWPRPGWSAEGPLPGYATLLNSLFALQCVLGAVLLAAAIALHRAMASRTRVPLAGMAGPVAAILGTLLGGALSAAVVYQAAGWLGGCYYPGAEAGGCIVLRPAAAYSWLQLAFTLEAAIALLCAGAVLVALRRRARREARVAARMYGRPVEAGRTRDIARARAFGAVTEYLPACLAALLLPVAALVGLVLYSVLTGQLTPVPGQESAMGPPAAVTAGWPQRVLTVLVGVGSFLGGGFLAALMALGGSAYRDKPTRQAVGVLWDVGTFWPRLAHPLAPPCYGERAVPQLVARVTDMTDRGTAIVLSGHSQGSVLAAATLWQAPARCRDRVALMTHGAPLSRLYACYFPAYFGPAAFTDLRIRTAHWRNLWRATDPIGGPVLAAADGGVRAVGYAEPLPDPRHYGVRPGEVLYPPILGHSYYTRDPMYAESVRHATALLTGAGDASVVGAGPKDGGAAAPPAAHSAVPTARSGDDAADSGDSASSASAAQARKRTAPPAGEGLPASAGPLVASDSADGGADVEQVDERSDQRDEDEEAR